MRNFVIYERLIIAITITVAIKIHGIEVGVVNLDTPSTDIRDVEEKRSTSRHLRDCRAFVDSTCGGCGIGGVIHYHECVMGKVSGIDGIAGPQATIVPSSVTNVKTEAACLPFA